MRRKTNGSLVQSGREISKADQEEIAETVALFPALSLTELVRTICEHLEWYSASGGLKYDACLKLLKRMKQDGLIPLPEKQYFANVKPTKKPLPTLTVSEDAIEGSIGCLGPSWPTTPVTLKPW